MCMREIARDMRAREVACMSFRVVCHMSERLYACGTHLHDPKALSQLLPVLLYDLMVGRPVSSLLFPPNQRRESVLIA